jgi:hypothetical protein
MRRLHFLASSVRAALRELTRSADDVSGFYIRTATALVRIVATFSSDHYLITMAELPKTYKACVYDQPGKISTKVVSLDVPEPGPGEVLVKLSVSCGRKGLYPPSLANLTVAHTQAYAIPTSASWPTAGRLFLCQLSPAKLEATKASAGSLSLVQA